MPFHLISCKSLNKLRAEGHYRLLNRSSKFSFFLLLLIVVPVAFNLNGLLGLWLKEVPDYTAQFCLILLMAYLVDAIGAPLSISVIAHGSIKGMQIWSSFFLLAGLIASFIFLRKGAEPWIVAIITFVVHVGFLLTYLYYARKLCSVRLRAYFCKVILPAFIVTVVAITIPLLLTKMNMIGWQILIPCGVSLIWVALVIFLLGLSKEERRYVLGFFVKKGNTKQ